jgi:bla regulator protein BlaR1
MTLFDAVLSRPEWSAEVLTFLLRYTLKATVIIGLAFGVTLLFRRTVPACRHLILCTAVNAILLFPVLALLLPEWTLSLLSQLAAPWSAGVLVMQGGIGVEQGPFVGQVAALPWTTWAVALWFLGALIILTRLIIGLVATRQIARRARVVSEPWLLALTDDIRRRLGLRRLIRVAISTEVTTPFAWGIFRPIIILPQNFDRWQKGDIRFVLVHELAHISRYDVVSVVIAGLITAMHWVNPLVWIARKDINIEAEKACDDYVLCLGHDSNEYALHLLSVLRSLKGERAIAPVGVGMARRSHMEGRLMSILSDRKRTAGLRRSVIIATTSLILLLAFPLAALQLDAVEGEVASEEVDTAKETFPPPDEIVKCDIQPELTFQQDPEYPEEARKAGQTGDVWIKALIDKNGEVGEAMVAKSSGFGLLDKAALKAAYGNKYNPAVLSDSPVACWVSYKVSFVLDNKKD